MEEIINRTKEEFTRSKERMTHALATTPDDKLQWAPSTTARTPLHLVAHGAMAISGIRGMLVGKPFPYANIAEFDTAMRESETEFTTREQVLDLLEKAGVEYVTWLDTLTPEQLAATINLPFGPSTPMAVAITFPAFHIRNHVAQIDYIQTIYGDHDWHF